MRPACPVLPGGEFKINHTVIAGIAKTIGKEIGLSGAGQGRVNGGGGRGIRLVRTDEEDLLTRWSTSASQEAKLAFRR